jgi:hypothetical protein
MLSSVLDCERAVQMNIRIVRAFVKLRGCWQPIRTWHAGSRKRKSAESLGAADTSVRATLSLAVV